MQQSFDSTDLAQRSLAAVWHPCTQMQQAMRSPPLALERGSGPWLYDTQGRRYFDAISSWWVNVFGHAHAGIQTAITQQLERLPHAMLAGCTHEPVVALSEKLAALTDGHLGHAFYASDGASAVEIALKMSFHYWRNVGQPAKQRFVCLQGSYHGETLGALAVTDVAIFRSTYDALIQKPVLIASPACADPAEQNARMAASLAELEAVLAEQSEQIAALILEPLVQAASGMMMYPPEYLRQARALCSRYEVHVIADEIAVGCGRTGRFFAWQHSLPEAAQSADWPDFITLSKGITGGTLPLSVVLNKPQIYKAFLSDDMARGFLHSHSYTGNPLACAAALAVLAEFENGALARLPEQAELLRQAVAPLWADARIENQRQIGCIAACDVKEAFAGEGFSQRFYDAARQHELLIRPIGRSIYVMPPYILNEEWVAFLQQALQASLQQALAAPAAAGVEAVAI